MTDQQSTAGSAPAVLFDIDGTLVDSNYLHVHAWHRSFADEGLTVESWRVHRSIGMDGSTLLDTLVPDADDDARKRLKEGHSRYYLERKDLLQLLPGARALLERVQGLGLQVVLATSAPEDELEVLREVLDSEDVFSAMTSGEDVDTAKPQPDIVNIALERAGVDAHRAVFVGDAVWDIEACERAGVTSIGVLSGGVSRGELTEAGARAVFENAEDLRTHLEESPVAALLDRTR
ncbi:HAD family hydrolase [Mycolicibacterium litorale]|uniref:Haloacid dehalogenase n=1 Tax=Mycolicibacterium litorale TaxID=758802 RepID=A0AAD1MUA2_9MYCO|nr:HAD family hydrolase [Mycolicibacterium litorale]MCV7414823.1 HAD family hydrolase [Mycolicibacterium litorale]TDY08069.1 HAD superfamily hydrolase (TIGR01509 family)/HAD superfamily hydrolase (TIGR01549 family) [Mycolicibacterium litorale]BBY15991.1 haloacid dehalogenase [Mycolicibacterium litorale]